MNNRHPVDELADLRAAMSEMKKREYSLREMIIRGECERYGDDFAATVSVVKGSKLDIDALEQEFGLETLQRFRVPTETTYVRTKAMRAEG